MKSTQHWDPFEGPLEAPVCVSLCGGVYSVGERGDGHLHHPDLLQHLPSIWCV